MKKTLILLITILVVIFIALSLSNRGEEYTAERLLYKTLKQYDTLLLNPDVLPPQTLKSVENNLKKIMVKFPKSGAAKRAHLKLMELYFTAKQYDKAISVADEIINTYKEDSISSSKALFLKATSYELSGRWGKALSELEILKNKYLNTSLGLQVPFYIANYYRNKGEVAAAQKAFLEAASFYKNLKYKYKGTPLGYVSSNILVQTYMSLDNYEEAGKVVKDAIFDYPTTTTLAQQLAYVELIFVKTLKKPEEAIAIYKAIIEKSINDKITTFLQGKIGELEKQK